MTVSETVALLTWLGVHDSRYRFDEQERDIAATAWWELLPGSLMLLDAKRYAGRLMREGQRVTAAAIRLEHERAHTPAYRQGVDSMSTPLEPVQARLALDMPSEAREQPKSAVPLRPGSQGRVDVRSVICPHCGAYTNMPCRNGGRPALTPHPSRYERAGQRDPTADRLARTGNDEKARAHAAALLEARDAGD